MSLLHEPLAKFIDRVIFPPLEGASPSSPFKPDGLAGLVGHDRHQFAALLAGQERPLVERARPARDVFHRRDDSAGGLHPGDAVALDVVPEQRRDPPLTWMPLTSLIYEIKDDIGVILLWSLRIAT
jgi:hypothetical protein